MAENYSYYPLTFPQKNIFKTEITYPGTTIGVISATLRITDENLNLDYVEKALNLVIENNDAMRCRIKIIDREPRQYFVDYKFEKFDRYDYSEKPIKALFDYDEVQTRTPFELIESPLYYFSIIKLSDSECAIYTKVHHIINDAWAIVRVGNLVLDNYERLSKNITDELAAPPSYTEYISDELSYLAGDRLEVDRAFWDKKLEEPPNSIILKPRKSKIISLKSKRKTFLLPERLSNQLRQYCKDTRTSIFAVILSAFSIYIKRTMQKGNMVIGTPVLNRSSRRQKNTIGMFISTVPLFIDLEEDDNFTEFNKKLTREWMAVLKHQRYPFEYILKEAREKYKDLKELFDVVISYQNASFTENQSSAKHKSRWHFMGTQLESLSIHINDREGEGILVIDYDFLEDMFFEKEIDFLHDNFIRVLWHALDNPLRKMSKLELISEEEKRRILFDFNSKTVDYPRGQTIIDLFEAQVKKVPDNIALIHEDRQVTYSQLGRMVNSLAHLLIEKGVKREDIVSLMIDKSIEMIAAIFAILKAGGAYLAVDGEFPDERKKYLFEDSCSKILITADDYLEGLNFAGDVISVTNHDFAENIHDPEIQINSSDLAYVIYTSGTTGEPKGVMIEHGNVVNYCHSFQDEFRYTGEERVIVHSSYSYDGFVEEVYPGLSQGSTLVIANKYGARDIKSMAEVMRRHRVTDIGLTPLVLSELNKINNFPCMNRYLTGGDVLKYEYMNNLIENAQVFNTYGPTEATVCAAFYKCDSSRKENIPIGKPIANYKIYILDNNLNLVPIGVAGELYISGPGLARGYLNKPELTEEAFIDNPYLPGEKMYRTKDQARWYPMGDIEYIGRADRQVKIRGMRVELGEIESKLIKHEKIHTAVVLDRINENNKKLLCAYYEANSPITVQEIREYLRKELASHMIPSYYLEMEKIPWLPSGKANTGALPGPDAMVLNEENEFIAPTDETEERLVDIIKNLLKLTKVGINDNYFELGGDSLDVTTLAYDIMDEFDVEVPLEVVFNAETIKDIAGYIKKSGKKGKGIKKEKNLILLNRGKPDRANLFFVHDGVGGVGAYVELCEHMREYNVWGLRADDAKDLHPRNLTIEEIARTYVEQIIDECAPPYNLAGWCIGGTIAYEMVRQLENLGLDVNALLLIDTIPPMKWEAEYRFTAEGELEFIKENIAEKEIYENIEKPDSIKALWEKMLGGIENHAERARVIKEFVSHVPEDILGYLNDFDHSTTREIFSFINQLRTFHIARVFYTPIENIKSDIIYIGAKENSVVADKTVWQRYTEGKSTFEDLEGDHYSIMKMPAAGRLIETVKDWA